ncbi:MAG: DUF3990 domain-containing protein [Lachnospiraceae bacterium]|nr:DUF3990 domain-containing protein [Lachnospiraceae bacterium]
MIKDLYDGIELYHGSYCEVRTPDINMCARYKDFGRGFYLTTEIEQARQFAMLSARKAKANGIVDTDQKYGVVSSFKYRVDQSVMTRIYPEADASWLHCIVGHRKTGTFDNIVSELEKYDIIGGKIANDATNATILTYMAGTLGEVGSSRADQICISLLLPERLKDQFCFRTEKGLRQLEFIESEQVWMR